MLNHELFLGIDTSCYTTSAACVCANGIEADERILLSVESGDRGLRQSDAVFRHVRNAESLIPKVLNRVNTRRIAAVGVSSCPSAREGSYMPVFLVGKTLASSIAAALGVPLYCYTHQQGHIRAALFGNEELRGRDFLAFHLSGGTSELLYVDRDLAIKRVGGTTDINAGQLVDRLGVRMGLSFPAGKELEALALSANGASGIILPSSVKNLNCSFSGVETKAAAYLDAGVEPADVAYVVYDCIARTLAKLIINASAEFGINNFLLAGGVASSDMLRKMLGIRLENKSVILRFAEPRLSSDNAVGTAFMCMDEHLNNKQSSEGMHDE
ncbi:MAG: hypothetical protein J1E60_05450 [Christensenellaceae bacterium]|nr:hypothetical protein [Christensenellaceae bacterium]